MLGLDVQNDQLAAAMVKTIGRPPHAPTSNPQSSSSNSTEGASNAVPLASAIKQPTAPPGYNAALLEGPDGEEMCFEEVRMTETHRQAVS